MWHGAERHAHANLLSLLGHCVRHDAVDARTRDDERECTKCPDEQHVESALLRLGAQGLFQGLLVHRHPRYRRQHRSSNRGRRGTRCVARAREHARTNRRLLRQGKIHTGTDGFFRAHQVNVTHHANDDAFDFVDRNPLSYRVSAGKVSSGRFLIHHRHSRRSGTIAPVDHTPPAERLPHNVEVSW